MSKRHTPSRVIKVTTHEDMLTMYVQHSDYASYSRSVKPAANRVLPEYQHLLAAPLAWAGLDYGNYELWVSLQHDHPGLAEINALLPTGVSVTPVVYQVAPDKEERARRAERARLATRRA